MRAAKSKRVSAESVDSSRWKPSARDHSWRPASVRLVPTRANGQLAVGCYVLSAESGRYEALVLDVLTLAGERIAAVTAFIDSSLFAPFGLPESLPAAPPGSSPGSSSTE